MNIHHSAKRQTAHLADHAFHGLPIKTPARAERELEKGVSYKPLPAAFRHDGFDFEQVRRSPVTAIYKKSKPGCGVSFEVVVIRQRNEAIIHGRMIEPREVYPPDRAWGTHGFTFSTLEAATAKFNTLTA